MTIRSSRHWLISLLLGSALVSMASAGATDAQTMPGVSMTDDQDIGALRYDPVSVEVNAGDAVTWTNTGSLPHSVSADDASFDSGLISPGDTFSVTFSSPGTFGYHCVAHPWIKGSIVVTVDGATSDTSATSGSGT